MLFLVKINVVLLFISSIFHSSRSSDALVTDPDEVEKESLNTAHFEGDGEGKLIQPVASQHCDGVDKKNPKTDDELRFSRGVLLLNEYDLHYDGIIRKTKRSMSLEPYAIDYSLQMQKFEEDDPYSFARFNPINPNELRYHQLYFDYSVLQRKSPERVFVDFFAKYNAALASLHFIISAFIAGQGKDVESHAKISDLAYYTNWFLNLEFHRHVFELYNILGTINAEDEYYSVLESFINIKMGLDDLFSLDILTIKTRDLHEYGKKENPFSSINQKQIFPRKGYWLLITTKLRELKEDNMDDTIRMTPKDFELIYYKEDEPPLDPVEHPRTTKFFHEISWDVVDKFLGRDIFRLESFFYSILTGKKYKKQHFNIPSIKFFGKLWNEIGNFRYKIWEHDPTVTRQTYNKHGEKIYRSNVIEILRQIEHLRFDEFSYENANYDTTKEFRLLRCGKLLGLLKDFKCHYSLKMITDKE